MKLFSRIPPGIIFPLLIVWQILLTFQGLDLGDTGFHLTAFRFIFDDPYSVNYSMMFWLSDACGAMWMWIWPSGGLYWFKLGWVIFLSCTFLVYLSMLSPMISKRQATIGLAVTLIFILLGGPESLNYDIFSSLGYASGVIFLYRGLLRNRLWSILLSGFIFGICVFFKLSNLSSLAFLLLIPFSVFQKKEKVGTLLNKMISWLAGFGTGMVVVLLLIWRLGHLNLFLDNLSFVSAMGKDSHASHGMLPMLLSYMRGYLNAFIILTPFILLGWVYKRYTKQHASFNQKSQTPVLILIGLLAVVMSILLEDVFWSKIRYLFIALMIVQGIVLVIDKKNSYEIRLLSLSGLVLLLIAPLGSDSGLEKAIWGMWILGPMLLAFPGDGPQFRPGISWLQTRFIKNTIAIVILFTAMVHTWQRTYNDTGSRINKTYPIEHPLMKGIYTTQERAKVVNDLINNAFPLMEKDEYLLSFIEIPMMNYLSDKKPFISTSWPKLYYNPKTFRLKLEEALLRRKTFPAIIRQKQNTTLINWPSTPDPDYLSYRDGSSHWPEHGRILNEFIALNNYHIVWENEMFQLLIHR